MPTREFETFLIEKADSDTAFWTALLDDPRGTIEQELGVQLPDDINITVLEEAEDEVYIVLPSVSPGMVVEPNDGELDSLYSGGSWSTCGARVDLLVRPRRRFAPTPTRFTATVAKWSRRAARPQLRAANLRT